METIYKWLAGALVSILILVGVAYKAYDYGIEHQKGIYAEQLVKDNAKVTQKNSDSQQVADRAAKTQVIYKDKIVTEFVPITQEVIKYEKTQDATRYLDPEFIRLHNAAASTNGQSTITQSASGINADSQNFGVTTGEAIGTITRNYQQYQLCRAQVMGWNSFYEELQKKVNE